MDAFAVASVTRSLFTSNAVTHKIKRLKKIYCDVYRSIDVSGAGVVIVAVVAPSVAVSDEDIFDPGAGALAMVESGESSLSSGQLNDSFNFV